MIERPGRRVFNASTTPFQPYDLEGPLQPEMSWLPDEAKTHHNSRTQNGCLIAVFEWQRPAGGEA